MQHRYYNGEDSRLSVPWRAIEDFCRSVGYSSNPTPPQRTCESGIQSSSVYDTYFKPPALISTFFLATIYIPVAATRCPGDMGRVGLQVPA